MSQGTNTQSKRLLELYQARASQRFKDSDDDDTDHYTATDPDVPADELSSTNSSVELPAPPLPPAAVLHQRPPIIPILDNIQHQQQQQHDNESNHSDDETIRTQQKQTKAETPRGPAIYDYPENTSNPSDSDLIINLDYIEEQQQQQQQQQQVYQQRSPAEWLKDETAAASKSYPPRSKLSPSPNKSIRKAVTATVVTSEEHHGIDAKYICDDENRRLCNVYRNESKSDYDRRMNSYRVPLPPLSPEKQSSTSFDQSPIKIIKKTYSNVSSNHDSNLSEGGDSTDENLSNPSGVLQSLPLKSVFPVGFPAKFQKQTSTSSYVSNSSTISSYDDGDGTRVSKIKIPAVFSISVEGNNGQWSVENEPLPAVVDPNEVIKQMEDDNLSSTSDDRSTKSREIAASFNNLFGMFRCFFSAPTGSGSGTGFRRHDSNLGSSRHPNITTGSINTGMEIATDESGSFHDDRSLKLCAEYRSDIDIGHEIDHSFRFSNADFVHGNSLNGKVDRNSQEFTEVQYAPGGVPYNTAVAEDKIPSAMQSSHGQVQHFPIKSKRSSLTRRSLSDT